MRRGNSTRGSGVGDRGGVDRGGVDRGDRGGVDRGDRGGVDRGDRGGVGLGDRVGVGRGVPPPLRGRGKAKSRAAPVDGGTATRLTHLDERNRPTMVDVSAKGVTHRIATAEARVRFPPSVATALRKSGHRTKKGPVFDTAIVSGVMAAKRTHDLIPFCHPLPLDNCAIEIDDTRSGEILIRCQVSVHHRTGVEMEALTGATVAALTIYDMCKALSHDIEITGVRLVEKTGGKRDFKRKA